MAGLRLRGEPTSTAHLALPARPAPRRAIPSLTDSIHACSADTQRAVEMEGSEFDQWARAQMHPIVPRVPLMITACATARLCGMRVFTVGLCRCDASDGRVMSSAVRYVCRCAW